nr:1-aminocyclopropane-1-carboxylate oxidase like 1 [Quercus suber]
MSNVYGLLFLRVNPPPYSSDKQVVEEIKRVSETLGLFQIVNYGISEDVMDDMIKGIRRFHEQPTEVKREYYSHDATKNITYMSNFHLYKAKAANWRDSLSFAMAPVAQNPEEFPSACSLSQMTSSKVLYRESWQTK